jgi:hypothetical protein
MSNLKGNFPGILFTAKKKQAIAPGRFSLVLSNMLSFWGNVCAGLFFLKAINVHSFF